MVLADQHFSGKVLISPAFFRITFWFSAFSIVYGLTKSRMFVKMGRNEKLIVMSTTGREVRENAKTELRCTIIFSIFLFIRFFSVLIYDHQLLTTDFHLAVFSLSLNQNSV